MIAPLPSRAVGGALAALLAPALLACGSSAPRAGRTADSTTADSAFAGVQSRGRDVMGVDQYTSRHVFEDLPDGGRIVLEREDASDTAGVRTIREQMRTIAAAVSRGDFTAPGLVHARDVPGTDVMAASAAAIGYAAHDRPAGAEVRITTSDSAAVSAVHRFLAFQRSDHRAAGHEGHGGR